MPHCFGGLDYIVHVVLVELCDSVVSHSLLCFSVGWLCIYTGIGAK